MSIEVTCPNGHVLKVRDEFAGRSGLCPHCQARIQVPKPAGVSEDDVLSLLGQPRAVPRAAASPKAASNPRPKAPSNLPAPPTPRRDEVKEDAKEDASGISLPGSALLRRKRVCPKCCEIISLTFADCPYCSTPLSEWTFPLPDEAREQASRQVCRHLGVRKVGEVIVVRFGEHRILDESAVHVIGNELFSVADRPDCHHLLLNFSGLEGLTSVMLGTMLMLKKKMAAKQGKVKLCQVGPEIREVFSATKLGQLFEILDDEQLALKTFK